MSAQVDRLFILLDPETRRVIDLCSGPAAEGACPRYVAGQPLPCEGYKVIPLRSTSANGLPFRVGPSAGTRCPLAWLDSSLDGAEEGPPGLPASGLDGRIGSDTGLDPGEGSLRPAS